MKGNEARCTSCHAGYGWKDDSFDLSKEENIDCLVCHEQTGTYKKFPAGAGHPVSEPKKFGGKTFHPPDWQKVAQSVSRPSRENCGDCHFYGGGGDGVKHGDLDSSLNDPPKKLDVHMSEEGAGFNCTRCHTTRAHSIAGRCYKKPAFTERKSLIDDDMIDRIACSSCHTETPHEPGSKLDDHTDKVACQSCHIPAFARQNPTKMRWDWSKAGRLTDDGKPVVEKGEHGKPAYHGKKGAFRWEKDVKPEYYWFNGSLEYILLTDEIEPDEPVELNRVMGSADDDKSRIYPFKVHEGTLPFDTQNRTMLSPNLFGKEKEAYWKSYDWDMALETGMEVHGLDYSGEFEFIETEYYFPITHMVAPAEDALECRACHADQARLASLTGFYMPGRDQSNVLDTLGWLIVFGSLAGVVVHGIMRKVLGGKKG
ncbi:MAG: tetrathionate reductase family octaheme c-type cytochrome [Desulfobacterales bacterium]